MEIYNIFIKHLLIKDRDSYVNTDLNKFAGRAALLIRKKSIMALLFILLYSATLTLYFRVFFSIGNLDFADLGVFPLYPGQILTQYLYSWQLGSYGSQGVILPYSLVIYTLERIFITAGLAEKVWLLSLLPISSLSIFYLSYRKFHVDFPYSFLFAFLYAFNPVTAGLFYMGSINDTMTMYVFEPILVTAVFSIFSSKSYIEAGKWSILFVLIFYYVYSWSPQIIMWILPFLIIAMIMQIIINKKNMLHVKIALIGLFIPIILILLIAGNLQTFILILQGHGSATFATAAGSTSISDLRVDLSDNFIGQLSYKYAIFCFILSGVSIFSFLMLRRLLSEGKKILFVSSMVMILMILSIWTVFRFSILVLENALVSYVPEIAAYEPFMGITLLFSLFFLQMIILFSSFSNRTKSPSSTMNFPIKFKFIHNRKVILKIIMLVFVIVILLTSSIGYWRQDVPSEASQLLNPDAALGRFSVPNEYIDIAEWLNNHLYNTGGRYLLLPYVGLSSEAISDFIPEISSVTLPDSLWNELLTAGNNSLLFRDFSQGLSMLGVQYIVVNKGPYVPGDSNYSYLGPARIYPAGFPWQIQYLPAGSWQNWSLILRHDPYLKIVVNQQNWMVFQNSLFSGLFHVYILPNNFSMSDLNSVSGNGSILYSTNESLVPLNFTIPPQNNTFHYNWSKQYTRTGYIYTGGPLPNNMSYSNIWEQITMKNDTYYQLNYSVSGVNMSNAQIFIRFYSGPNMSGDVVSTISSPSVAGNVSNLAINFVFKTPVAFNSSAIFLTYMSNPKAAFYSYSFQINYLKYEIQVYPVSKPFIINYHYINPTELIVDVHSPGNMTTMILYSATYNPSWVMTSGLSVYRSHAITLFSSLIFNSYLVKGNISHLWLNFTTQKAYSSQLIYELSLLAAISIILVLLSAVDFRRNKNERG